MSFNTKRKMKGAKILQSKIGLESGDEGVNGVWIWTGYNNVIHINEKENQFLARTINKERSIRLTAMETKIEETIAEVRVPSSWCLLEPIKGFPKMAHMCGIG